MSKLISSFALTFAATIALTASPAMAVPVLETDEYSIELRGLGEAGYVGADDVHNLSTGPRIGIARLAARATYHDIARLFVQYEAASGQARLLDLLATLYVTDWLHIRLGHFKTPISVDYNISAIQKPFPARALITELTPRRRAGAELFLGGSLGEVTTNLHVGAFNPRPLGEAVDGAFMVSARGEVKWPFGLGIHLGYVDHFDSIDNEDPLVDPLFITEARLLDFAVTFQNTRWFAQAETVLAPSRSDVFAGIYAAVGHRFGNLRTEPTVEPIIGYDYVVPTTGEGFHRLRAGVNGYILDYRVVPNLHYEMTINPDGEPGHAVYALLRMSI